MKKALKCLSVIIVMLIILFSFSITALAQTTTQDGLQVNLTTDKQSYSLNEDIQITISVTNTNDFTVKDVSIEALLPDKFELKDSNDETSTKAIDLKSGEQANLTVVAVVKGEEQNVTNPTESTVESSTKPDSTTEPTTKPIESNTGNTQNTKPNTQTTTSIISNNDNNKSDKSNDNTKNNNNQDNTSIKTGSDYTYMCIFIVLLLASISTLLYCLIKHIDKTTKIVSSILCVVIAVISVVGISKFNAFAQENNSSTITVSEQIKVDNNNYTITANVSYKVNDNINLTIDNKEETVTNFNQKLSGKFSLASNVVSVTYTIATEIDDYEITDSGNAVISDNTYSADIQLKPQINKITVTATTESGKTESKTVKITYDSGKIYELDESHIAYDSETNTHYVNNIILIFFDEGVSDDRKNKIVSSINGKVVGSINGINQWQVEVETMDLESLYEICNKIDNMDGVYATEIDRISSNTKTSVSVNDPYKNANGGDWYLDAIEAYSAWDYNERFNYIDIGVVDNGFDVGHEDLEGVIKFPNEALKSNNKKAKHGTHVAGIIGANANNKKGMAGLVWKNTLWCVDWQPEGKQEWDTENEILSGLTYTVESGAKVVNYSLNKYYNYYENINNVDAYTDSANLASKALVELLIKGKDFVVVQSSGNGTEDGYAIDTKYSGYFASIKNSNIIVPQNVSFSKRDVLDRIIIVGNAQKNDDGNYQQEVSSNGGSRVDICAPGTNIYSTVPGEVSDGWGGWINGAYANLNGTSMAAPMVTSVCGMVWSVNSNFTGAEVKDIVCNSYDENIWVWDNPDGKHTTNDNYRMLNAKLSVEEAIRRTDKRITGQVIDANNNEPISNVKISCDEINIDCTTDKDGKFSFDIDSHSKQHTFTFEHENYKLTKITISPNGYSSLKNVKLQRKTGSVCAGIVRDSKTNNPIKDVRVEVIDNSSDSLDPVVTTTTDENGNFSLNLPYGSYSLSFHHDNYNYYGMSLDVDSEYVVLQNPILLNPSIPKIYKDYLNNVIVPQIGICNDFEKILSGISESEIYRNIDNPKGLSSVYIEDLNNDKNPEMITISALGEDNGFVKIQVKLYCIENNKVVDKGIVYETEKYDNADEQLYVYTVTNDNNKYLCLSDRFWYGYSTGSIYAKYFKAFSVDNKNSLSEKADITYSYKYGNFKYEINGETISDNKLLAESKIKDVFNDIGIYEFDLNWSGFPEESNCMKIFECGTEYANATEYKAYLKDYTGFQTLIN